MVAISSAGKRGLLDTICVARKDASTLSLLRTGSPLSCVFRVCDRMCEVLDFGTLCLVPWPAISAVLEGRDISKALFCGVKLHRRR